MKSTLILPLQVKGALAEIFKMLKPGGKLMFYESHVIQYLEADDKATFPLRQIWITPKEDGTRWAYFADEGKPREVKLFDHGSNGDCCYDADFDYFGSFLVRFQ